MSNILDKYKIDFIPVKNLSVVWVAAQRPFNKVWAKNMADNFDPDLFEPIIVTKPNGQGIYHIIEGQHRKSALEMYAQKVNASGYGGNELAPCRVLPETNPVRAAQVWRGINGGRKAISAISDFKIAVVGQSEPEVSIDRIVRMAGYHIAPEKNDGCISAVQALMTVYSRHGELALTKTLNTIKNLWGMNPQAVASAMLRGFGMFMHEFSPHIDPRKLQKVSDKYDPWRLMEAAKARKESTLERLDEAISELLFREYNRGLKDPSNRLKRKE